MSDTIPTDYCPDCRLTHGLPPTTGPVGTYQSCPTCDPGTPILSCPEHRSPALADLDLPAGQYYYCPACDCEWCDINDPSDRLRDIGIALAALTWLTFQCGVYFVFMLGFVLALTQHYGYAPEDAIGPAAGYAFLFFIFWILLLFPALFDLITTAGRHAWRGIWGQST
jgi:hypothetical protein